MGIAQKIFGDPQKRAIKKLEPIVAEINSIEKKLGSLSDADLQAKTEEFRSRLQKAKNIKKELEAILPEAFAVVKNACSRLVGQSWEVRGEQQEWSMVPFDVQLIGGILLHRGSVIEMKTGEGKTLVAVLPVYLNALTGRGVHIVTVNEYLAQRDAEWMGGVYNFLGLTVGSSLHGQTPDEKKEAYQADITYGTNNEFGFDYLRDNMVGDVSQKVQRELSYAIVDEVDSILIDEARTPLIISAPNTESTDKYFQFSRLVPQLKENTHYNVDEKLKVATLTEKGIDKIEQLLGTKNIYEDRGIETVHHIEQALKAHTLFQLDRDYVVKDGEVIIVDEFTGRLMPGRRYSEGLHQAIEAKENVDVQQESLTLATITFQNYFRMYDKMSGMTGTALTQAEEFAKVYELETYEVPTHKPVVRKDLPDRIYKNEAGKFTSVTHDIKERYEKGQPVLVGTISIEKSEKLSELLTAEGVPHEVLNAKHHEREAKIIAHAGKKGAVTIATNMAGRGTDIRLGNGVKEVGGLHVLGTERHEARRIDNQLRGRSGRQGDSGSSQFYVSMDDDLLRLFGSDRMKGIMERLGVRDDEPIQNRLISKSIESAQTKVEGHNFDIRKHLVDYDDVMNRQREVIYKKRNEVLLSWELEKQREAEEKGTEYNPPIEVPKKIKPLRDQALASIENELVAVVESQTMGEYESSWNIKEIFETLNTIFPADDQLRPQLQKLRDDIENWSQDTESREKLIKLLQDLARQFYDKREQDLTPAVMRQLERAVFLKIIDSLWIEHLSTMNYLREGVRLRGYGQRDPLIEYKKESINLFDRLLASIQGNFVNTIFKVNIAAPKKSPMETARKDVRSGKEDDSAQKPKKQKKIGRNEPCPCGSGKKYKKCCGR